ncbi:MAG TPA: hypothetical protein ENJ86_12395 [Methylothermaceae bacterium]|nr:hypothetical protein [Methylothermaceae bacterium]
MKSLATVFSISSERRCKPFPGNLSGLRYLLKPGQVVCFEKRREYFPLVSTPASLPARFSKQTTCPGNQYFRCLNDAILGNLTAASLLPTPSEERLNTLASESPEYGLLN